MKRFLNTSLKIALIYALFGVLWIIITDAIVNIYFDDFVYYSTVKGLIFIGLSSLVLYFVVKHHLSKRERYEAALNEETKKRNLYIKALNEQSKLLNKLIDESPVPMMLHAENKRILRVSKSFTELSGYALKDIPTLSAWLKKAYRERADKIYKHIEKLYTINTHVYEGTFAIYTKEGRQRLWDFYSAFIGYDENGLRNIISIAIDITEYKQKEDHLVHLSIHDELTDVYNRRYFAKYADDNKDGSFHLLVADIDALSLINDLYGHYKGNALLHFFVDTLKDILPASSVICRIGGDEFGIFIHGADQTAIESYIKKIKTTIQSSDLFDFHLSVSFGFSYKDANTPLEKVFSEANNQLAYNKTKSSQIESSPLLEGLMNTLYEKTDETPDHVKMMMTLGKTFAEKLDLDEKDKEQLRLLITYHDIGKIGIDKALFRKKTLTDEEWQIVKQHPIHGYKTANALPAIKNIAYLILTHQENIDGSGYPFNLKDDDIPTLSKILRILDSYSTMISPRVYQEKKTPEEAVNELKKYAGIYYDESLLKAFLETL